MTDKQRRALHLGNAKDGARVRSPAQRLAPDDVAFQTARKVVAKGWASLDGTRLRTTPEGRKAINAPQFDDGLYLHAKLHRGYTDNPRHAPKGEPQPMDKPSCTWQAEAHRALAEARLSSKTTRKEEATQLANRARSSGRHGWRTTRAAGPVTHRRVDDAEAA